MLNSDSITLTRPDDCHLHLRDEEIMQTVLAHTANQFARAIIMPNLRSPIFTTAQALAYRQRILKALPLGKPFQPLMTLYLTEVTSSEEILKAHEMNSSAENPMIIGVKLYPAGATTHSQSGVKNIKQCSKVFEKMQEIGMPLLVHGEITDTEVDIFDRESYFIDQVLEPLRKQFPALKIVFEHITTKQAVQYVISATGAAIGATITAHHLLFNRNSLFNGGIRPHYYCLPVLKREEHRLALISAIASGNSRFFLGTDSAPHLKEDKESQCGCAGCYTAYHALELYAEAFEMAQALPSFEAFAAFNGADFYGLPRNTAKITLNRKQWRLPLSIPIAQSHLIPLRSGEILNWQLSESNMN